MSNHLPHKSEENGKNNQFLRKKVEFKCSYVKLEMNLVESKDTVVRDAAQNMTAANKWSAKNIQLSSTLTS